MQPSRLLLASTLALASTLPAPPAAAQNPPAPASGAEPVELRVAFRAAPGRWTPELPRLAARLEMLLAERGLEVLATEIFAPGVVSCFGRARDRASLGERSLRTLLDRPELAPWEGLELLFTDAEPAPRPFLLSVHLDFHMVRPEAATRTTEDLAREIARRHLLQRGCPASSAEDLLRTTRVEVLRETPSASRGGREVRVRFDFHLASPAPLEVARLLALVVPTLRAELRPAAEENPGVLSAVRTLPGSARLDELRSRARAASAGRVEALPRRGAQAHPLRRGDTLAFVDTAAAGAGLRVELRSSQDATGHPCLEWSVPEGSRSDAPAPGAGWILLVEDEAWGGVSGAELRAGRGTLFGDFTLGDVEFASRASQPFDPPASWTVVAR